MDLSMMSKEDLEKVTNLALQILRQGQNRLVVNLRFLDLALGQFSTTTFTNYLIPSYKTNGKIFVFNPLWVIHQYKENKNNLSRDFLHIIFHCLFRHMYISSNFESRYWNLACDIAVENMINELGIDCLEVPKCEEQRRQVNKLRNKVKYITAECLYDFFKKGGYPDEIIEELSSLFFVDYHDDWYAKAKDSEGEKKGKKEQKDSKKNKNDKEGDGEGSTSKGKDKKSNEEDEENENSSSSSEDNDGEEENNQESQGKSKNGNDDSQGEGEDESDQNENGSGNGGDQEEDGNSKEDNNSSSSSSSSSSQGNGEKKDNNLTASEIQDMMDHWKDISEKVQVDLETFNKERGDEAGSMMQNLREVNREKYDYTSFLKKFATMGEVMKINDDEFDYVYYTYGLSVYKNMPLVEPLEYKDVKRVKDFVIAIDTSGSVEGDLVQSFLQKTYNILKSTESFFSKINLHIIQCDAEIHEDKKITSQSEFDEYIKTMELKGFGGTDFRPVFTYVDSLIQQHEFTNLKGLIYFTDGMGTYPLSKPEYSTAFVFIEDNDYNDYEVPSWAVKLILEENDIVDKH